MGCRDGWEVGREEKGGKERGREIERQRERDGNETESSESRTVSLEGAGLPAYSPCSQGACSIRRWPQTDIHTNGHRLTVWSTPLVLLPH